MGLKTALQGEKIRTTIGLYCDGYLPKKYPLKNTFPILRYALIIRSRQAGKQVEQLLVKLDYQDGSLPDDGFDS